jgi:hypothetical protein
MRILTYGILTLSIFTVVGCAVTTQPRGTSLIPAEHALLSRVSALQNGMTTDEVRALLGSDIIIGYEDIKPNARKAITIQNPYRNEEFSISGRTYKVLYYLTQIQMADDIISENELTPLVFLNDKLLYKTWDDLSKLKNQL